MENNEHDTNYDWQQSPYLPREELNAKLHKPNLWRRYRPVTTAIISTALIGLVMYSALITVEMNVIVIADN